MILEIFISKKFQEETAEIKARFKRFLYFQIVSPEEFEMLNADRLIKFENNLNNKQIDIIAN